MWCLQLRIKVRGGLASGCVRIVGGSGLHDLGEHLQLSEGGFGCFGGCLSVATGVGGKAAELGATLLTASSVNAHDLLGCTLPTNSILRSRYSLPQSHCALPNTGCSTSDSTSLQVLAAAPEANKSISSQAVVEATACNGDPPAFMVNVAVNATALAGGAAALTVLPRAPAPITCQRQTRGGADESLTAFLCSGMAKPVGDASVVFTIVDDRAFGGRGGLFWCSRVCLAGAVFCTCADIAGDAVCSTVLDTILAC